MRGKGAFRLAVNRYDSIGTHGTRRIIHGEIKHVGDILLNTVELQATLFDDIISGRNNSGYSDYRFTVRPGINNQVVVDGIRVELLTVKHGVCTQLQAVSALIQISQRNILGTGCRYVYDLVLYLNIVKQNTVQIPFHYFRAVTADPVRDGGGCRRVLHQVIVG